jgi:hypothetical protein
LRHWYLSVRLHVVTSQKTVVFRFATMRTSNSISFKKKLSLLGMGTTSAITHISCAMSSQSLSVCLEDYVHFQVHQTRYVCTEIFWHGDNDDNWKVCNMTCEVCTLTCFKYSSYQCV